MIILVTKRVEPRDRLEFHPRLDPRKKLKQRLHVAGVTVVVGMCAWLFLSLLLDGK